MSIRCPDVVPELRTSRWPDCPSDPSSPPFSQTPAVFFEAGTWQAFPRDMSGRRRKSREMDSICQLTMKYSDSPPSPKRKLNFFLVKKRVWLIP